MKLLNSFTELSLAAKVLGIAFGFFAAHILPIASFLMAIGVLVMVDLVTGIAAAKKRKEKIRSQGLRNSVIKTVWYFLAILTGHMMQSIFFKSLEIDYFISSFIAVIEFKSLLENIAELTGADVWTHLKNLLTKTPTK